MCGRFSLTSPPSAIDEMFGLTVGQDLTSHYNIAPGTDIPIVRAGESARELVFLRWGFVPHWAKTEPDKLLINARGETLAEKPSFRDAARKRRCLIPANGFYEWWRGGKKPQPYFIRPKEDFGPIAYAGIWDSWQTPSGETIETVAIITIQANETLRAIHHRMPVVIVQKDFDRWLDPEVGEEALDLLQAADDAFFEAIPVGPAVNKVANNGPEIQQHASHDDIMVSSDAQLSLFGDE